MPGVKHGRQSFTFEYKLKVITRADEIGNRAAAREFEIDESMIHYWRKEKVVMTKLPKCQRTCCTGMSKFPALERTLKEWIVSQRETSRGVTTVMICLKAKELEKQTNVADSGGGPSWCSRFMCRNLWVRSCQKTGKRKLRTSVSLFLDERRNLPNKRIVFSTWTKCVCHLMLHIQEQLRQLELKAFLYQPLVMKKQASLLSLRAQSPGKKLKPMVIFKKKTMPKENLPNGVVVHCHKKGWMDRDRMPVWGEKVWHARPVCFFDSFSAHIDEGIRNTFKTEHKTTTAVIPGGLTKKLQPIDISVNRSFKNHVFEEWEKWMSEGIHTFSETGKMRRATHVEGCNWVIQVWKEVKVTVIMNGFRKAGITSVPGAGEDGVSDASEIRDDERSMATLDPVLDGQLIDLFHSDIEDEAFDGF